MIIRSAASARIPLSLIDDAGAPVIGMLPPNITNGSVIGRCSVVRNDGSVHDLVLTVGTNFFEINSVKAPGLYHVVIPAAATNQLGTLQLVVLPNASEFLQNFITVQVS